MIIIFYKDTVHDIFYMGGWGGCLIFPKSILVLVKIPKIVLAADFATYD